MQQAARISQNVAFILLGEVIETGSASEIFSRAKDPRTEAYLTGRMG
jgi:phosphate transport system ATP-binding protein